MTAASLALIFFAAISAVVPALLVLLQRDEVGHWIGKGGRARVGPSDEVRIGNLSPARE